MESKSTEKNTAEQKPIIDLRNVTKVYRVGSVDVHALRGIDLKIMPGEFCCIIGRSGSGKSHPSEHAGRPRACDRRRGSHKRQAP